MTWADKFLAFVAVGGSDMHTILDNISRQISDDANQAEILYSNPSVFVIIFQLSDQYNFRKF